MFYFCGFTASLKHGSLFIMEHYPCTDISMIATLPSMRRSIQQQPQLDASTDAKVKISARLALMDHQ